MIGMVEQSKERDDHANDSSTEYLSRHLMLDKQLDLCLCGSNESKHHDAGEVLSCSHETQNYLSFNSPKISVS
jgi:hypothetical protein